MALVNKSFSVNVTPGMMPPIVHVSEYDVGRAYTVSILDEQGNTFIIPSGTTASIEGTLNGSVGFTQSATVSNNQVSFTLSESMTAYSGKAWCKIKLTQNSQPIQTCAFVLAVDRAGVEADTVIGAPGFEEQIAEAAGEWLEDQGFTSPTIGVTEITGGHRVTVTDYQGSESFDVMNGTSVEVDPTLTISGAAADAKVVGELIGFNFINTPDKWENKGFNNGVEYEAPDRIKLIGYIPEEITHIKTDGSYSFLLYAFDESNQYIGYWTGSGFGTSGYVYETDLDIPDTNYNLAVVVKNNDSNTISPSESSHVNFSFDRSGLIGDVAELQNDIEKVKEYVGYQEQINVTYSYNDLLTQIPEQYSNVYVSPNSVGLSLADALGSSQGDTTKIFVIPCSGGSNVSYPVFKSSYNLGCAFLDKEKVVISQLQNSTLATGTQVDVTAPANAKYFVFVMSPSLLNMSSNVSVTVTTTEEEIAETDVLNALVKATPRFLPYLASLASDSEESLCLCGIKTKYQSNTLPFEEGFLFHKINSTEKKFYYGTTLHNAVEVGTVPFDPKLYFYGISPTDGRVICGRRETTGSLYVWDGTTATELFASATRKPYGWLYTTGIEFIKDSNNVEHCVFGEYAHSASAPLYVWRGTYPYTSESDWERVMTINSISDSQTVGSIRHFHQVRRDPWTDVLYLTSGDNKNQLNWWYSTDYGATWTLLLNDANVGWEDNVARCCNLIFTEDFIYWGSDFGENHSLNRVARGANGIIDPSTRVKLADLPWGYATNSLCYVEHLNALFCYDRHDGYTQFSSLYGKPLNVNMYLIDVGVLKTVCAMPTKPEWGGHRGKAYVNYTNGQNPTPALGFSADTPCIFKNIGASAGLGTLFYEV